MDAQFPIGVEGARAPAGAAGASGGTTLRAGDVFGPFRVKALLGRGAMGEVYQVARQKDGAAFALKIIAPDLMRDERAVARFRQESKALCSLHSANIVSAEQVGEEGGRQWLAMQLCEGVRVTGADGRPRQARSLDEYAAARGGLLAQSVLLAVLDNILCGLAYAHDQGLVHRDLKPANILLARDEKGRSFRALISDFGLVRIVGEERVRERVEHSIGLSLTRGAAGDEARAWLGNWAYMSPEQKRGQPATKSSDLYAVGLLAYRLGTGKDLGLEAASELNPDLVPEWDTFIGKALEEQPENRYADAHAMRAELAAIRAAWERRQASRRGEDQGRQQAQPARRVRPLAFAGLVGAGAAALAGFFLFREPLAKKVAAAAGLQAPLVRTSGAVSGNAEQAEVQASPAAAQKDGATGSPPSGLVQAAAAFTNASARGAQAAGAVAPAARRTVLYDLAADWSDTANPNGCWTYLLNGAPAKSGVRGMDPFASAGPPNIWGRNRRCEGWSKSGGTVMATLDIQAGDVDAHTTDARGAVAFRWTSPLAGSIDLSGGVWPLRDIGRATEWRLCLNGRVLASGISSGHDRTRSQPEKVEVLQVAVKPGDAVDFYADKHNNFTNDYLGVTLAITLAVNDDAAATNAFGGTAASQMAAAPTCDAATKDRPWTNSLGMRFVPVPGTDTLFCIWPARVQDFEAFVADAGYQATTNMFSIKGSENWGNRGDSWQKPGFAQGPTHPVVGVNWYDAQAFCAWLTRKEQSAGVLDAGRVYRLPTEAEWSLAEGPTNQSAYAWGNQWPPPPSGGNFAGVEVKGEWPSDWGVIEGYRDDYPRTAPVGSFAANPIGLFDMAGNVGQWCADLIGGRAIWRGSSWYDFESRRAKLGARNGLGARFARTQTGFRVVLGASASGRSVSPAAALSPATGVRRSPVKEKDWKSPATGMEFVWISALKMWVGKYEVTNGEYHNKVPGQNSKDAWLRQLEGDRQPVVFISFKNALAYAEWLTEQDRSWLGGLSYRLPSEAEWMTLAQCGDGREYPWGRTLPPKWGNYSDRISGYADGFSVACEVENSGANEWGLYGLGGNAWECCASDASGSSFGAWRGASWNTAYPDSLRCAFRSDFAEKISENVDGFRLVLTSAGISKSKTL